MRVLDVVEVLGVLDFPAPSSPEGATDYRRGQATRSPRSR